MIQKNKFAKKSTDMSEKKDFSLQGFEKTLNPKTVSYIDEKSSSMNKVDLRELSDNVRPKNNNKLGS